uniref:putative F-box protein At3g47150 n=1 Tax=Fragaria vesca subsp. vesca TaxID=101020 RepID=UPI0005CAAD79|nr:PREDICTED: putative F-box protein At3g47150 [Fragaria vesca subsp. vesca]
MIRKPAEIKDLTSDLMFAIFVKLPIKYLLRLTAVCKSYRQLIRSHEFKKFHHAEISIKDAHEYLLVHNRIGIEQWGLSIYSARTFRYDENSELPRYIDVPMRCVGIPLNSLGFTVYGSCNGLLCISLRSLDVDDPIFLYNPSLRKFKQLPQSDFKVPEDTSGHTTIIRREDVVTLGFGYHSGEDDYQVVRYAFLDGVIYWHLMQSAMSLVSFNRNTKVLERRTLTVNLKRVMRPICLQVLHPQCLRALRNDAQVSEKSLCLFQVNEVRQRDRRQQYCDIWDLKGNAEKRIYSIPIEQRASIARQLGFSSSIVWPLGFSTNGNVAYMVITDENQDLLRLV